MLKTCTSCSELKLLEDFGISKRSQDGRLPTCRKCTAAYHRKYRKQDHTKNIQECPQCDERFFPRNIRQVTCSRECYIQSKHRPKSVKEILPDNYKRCARCQVIKSMDNYAIRRASVDGKQSVCRQCVASWQESHKELRRKSWREFAAKKRLEGYGISEEDFKNHLERISGKCEICNIEMTLGGGARVVPDHNHDTGAFRGALCNNCNLVLGNALDNPAILREAANYLERH